MVFGTLYRCCRSTPDRRARRQFTDPTPTFQPEITPPDRLRPSSSLQPCLPHFANVSSANFANCPRKITQACRNQPERSALAVAGVRGTSLLVMAGREKRFRARQKGKPHAAEEGRPKRQAGLEVCGLLNLFLHGRLVEFHAITTGNHWRAFGASRSPIKGRASKLPFDRNPARQCVGTVAMVCRMRLAIL
jgi:hypothetical protein